MILSQKLSKLTLSIAVATGALSVSPAMAAASDVHTKTQEISILGYDLSDRSDASDLLARIQSASKRVCKIYTNRETVRERSLREHCAEQATATAVQSLNSPILTAVWNETKSS
nr:UrcA family protein [Hyphomonas sp. Mor2]